MDRRVSVLTKTISSPLPELRPVIYDTIEQIPQAVWDELALRRSEVMSWRFWRVLEAAALNDFRYSHVLFTGPQGEALGLTSFYSVTTDLAIFAPASLRRLLGGIRQVWPGFMKLRMLECGTPITIVSPPLAHLPGVSEAALADAAAKLLLQTARAQGQFLIVVRDFEPAAKPWEAFFIRHGFTVSDSLPNTYLDIRWPTPQAYLGAMRSYYRSKLLKFLKRNQAAGVTHELVEEFADLAETLHAQWMTVHESAREFQREVLTPDFYRLLSREMQGRAKVLLFRRHGALAGHALLLQDGEEMRWLYVGREVAEHDGLYLYIAQKVVETAILLGAKRLEMGFTTYPIKQDLGAEIVPTRMALRATNGFINIFVGIGYKLLNKVPNPAPRQIFKQEGQP